MMVSVKETVNRAGVDFLDQSESALAEPRGGYKKSDAYRSWSLYNLFYSEARASGIRIPACILLHIGENTIFSTHSRVIIIVASRERSLCSIEKGSIEDMWMSSLPIVSLLICAVLGNPEIDQLKNGSNLSKEGSRFEVEIMRKEPDPNAIVTENETQNSRNIECDLGVDSNMNIAAKKRYRKGTESWLDLTPKGKDYSAGLKVRRTIVKNNFLPKEFQDLFQKKDRWVYWWGDKRVSLYGPNLCIRESIRVPFDQGKPSYSLSNVPTRVKRDNFMYDRNERDNRGRFDDGNNHKKMSKIGTIKWKIPFYSWGGKRAQETFDRKPSREQHLMTITRPTLNDARVFGNLKDEFLNGENIENTIDENENPVHVNNEINENGYPTEEEISDDDNDWAMSTPSKRAQRRKARNNKIRRKPQKFRGLVRFVKSTFYPWGG